MEALGEGTLKGIYSPNQAKQNEGLPPVAGGYEPRVQQQLVPLTWGQDNEESLDEKSMITAAI